MANELMLLGCGPAGAGGASPYLLRDTFTDADGTALTSHTMDVGGGWVYTANGNLTIQSNRAQGDASNVMAHADAGAVSATVTVVTDSTGAFGIAKRSVTYNGTFLGFRISDTTLELYERNPDWTLRASQSVSVTGPYTLTLTDDGSLLSLGCNGSTPATYSTSVNNTVTTAGIITNSAGVYIDSFEVTA